MIEVVARHQPGHWSEVDDPSFAKNVVAMRKPIKGKRPTLVSRTELTDQSTNKTYRKTERGTEDNWAWYHPKFLETQRWLDCGLEWDMEFWKEHDHGVRILTDFQVTTVGGTLLLPSSMPWLLLESLIAKNWLLLFTAAHNNLDNNARRAAAWVDEGHSFRGFQKRMSANHPRLRRIHQCDANKNIRKDQERRMMRNGMLIGTGMKWGWNLQRLPRNGTHRDPSHQIIDYSCSNMECVGSTRIGGNTGFSDHNWIETIWKG